MAESKSKTADISHARSGTETPRDPIRTCLSHLLQPRLAALREAFNLAGSPVYPTEFECSDPLFKIGHQQARLEIRSAILELLQETLAGGKSSMSDPQSAEPLAEFSPADVLQFRAFGRREGLERALEIVRRFGATYRELDAPHGAQPLSVLHLHFEAQAAACMEIGGEIAKELANG